MCRHRTPVLNQFGSRVQSLPYRSSQLSCYARPGCGCGRFVIQTTGWNVSLWHSASEAVACVGTPALVIPLAHQMMVVGRTHLETLYPPSSTPYRREAGLLYPLMFRVIGLALRYRWSEFRDLSSR